MKSRNYTFLLERNSKTKANTKLSSNLSTWKLFADQFYRGSEIIYHQHQFDSYLRTMDSRRSRETGKPGNIGYLPFLDDIYYLLAGYCVEDMLKGLIIYDDPTIIQKSELSGFITKHDLCYLSSKVKPKFSRDEKNLLKFLSEHILWYSKYPMPKKASETVSFRSHNAETIRTVFKGIYKKLSDEMQATGSLLKHLHDYEFKIN